MRYYKATRPDGWDFVTGATFNYASALRSGEVVRHAAKRKVRDDPSTYISVSISPSDCTGFRWPCRLFLVEPVGRVMSSKLSVSRNKRAVSALCVVEELPAWQAFGPNGEAVVTIIDRLMRLTNDELRDLAAAWNAAWKDAAERAAMRSATWGAAWGAAQSAMRAAAQAVEWVTTWDAEWANPWTGPVSAGDAATAAAIAELVRDLITPAQYDLLIGPWREVIR
jgi:hypothetical protein